MLFVTRGRFEKLVLTEKEIVFEFETAGKRETQRLPRFRKSKDDRYGKRKLVEFSWGAKAIRVGKLLTLRVEKIFGEIKGYIC